MHACINPVTISSLKTGKKTKILRKMPFRPKITVVFPTSLPSVQCDVCGNAKRADLNLMMHNWRDHIEQREKLMQQHSSLGSLRLMFVTTNSFGDPHDLQRIMS